MKPLKQIWPQLVSFENMFKAYRKARKGKRNRLPVSEFGLNLERELLALQDELLNGTYRPGAYRIFTIYDRKPRVIAAAPFRDRVVHHALLNVIEAPLDRTFISDSYACRSGKGVHAAVDRYQAWAHTYPYVLKMDIQQYFPSIDHGVLTTKLRRRIHDPLALSLLDRIIDGSPFSRQEPGYFPGDDLFTPLDRRRGIPIGNLTSQFFANLYLDDFDHFVKQELGVRGYLRYVDDMVVLGHDKRQLVEVREQVTERLNRDRLRLHPNKAHISRTKDGLNLLGYVVYPRRRLLRNDNGHRFARKLRRMIRAHQAGRLEWDRLLASTHSWVGHAQHADTRGLRQNIFSLAGLIRGASQMVANG